MYKYIKRYTVYIFQGIVHLSFNIKIFLFASVLAGVLTDVCLSSAPFCKLKQTFYFCLCVSPHFISAEACERVSESVPPSLCFCSLWFAVKKSHNVSKSDGRSVCLCVSLCFKVVRPLHPLLTSSCHSSSYQSADSSAAER